MSDLGQLVILVHSCSMSISLAAFLIGKKGVFQQKGIFFVVKKLTVETGTKARRREAVDDVCILLCNTCVCVK